jgi:diacylglycerol kinase
MEDKPFKLKSMDNNLQLTFSSRIRSMKCAMTGIRVLISTQQNARIHIVITIIVTAFGIFLGLSKSDWCWIILAIILVWVTEALNTSFEFLTDIVSPTFHPLAEKAKDIAAAAVLIAAIGSILIGFLVFGPYLWAQISKF